MANLKNYSREIRESLDGIYSMLKQAIALLSETINGIKALTDLAKDDGEET